MTNRRTLRALPTAAVLVVTGVATLGPARAETAPAANDPMTGAPTVGTCSTMTADQAGARADHSTVVACSIRHTAQVAGVVALPDRLQWDTAKPTALYRVVAKRCLPTVEALLGRSTRTRDSSAYDLLWFSPTKAQKAHGARWLSCSVELRRGRALAALPKSTAPFLPKKGKLGDRVSRCLTKATQTTTCASGHRWRATGTFTVSGSYPGRPSLNRTAGHTCASRVTAGKPYRWTYQDKITWNAGGDHVVVCYSPTRS